MGDVNGSDVKNSVYKSRIEASPELMKNLQADLQADGIIANKNNTEVSQQGGWIIVGAEYIRKSDVSHFTVMGRDIALYGSIAKGTLLLSLNTDESVEVFKTLMLSRY